MSLCSHHIFHILNYCTHLRVIALVTSQHGRKQVEEELVFQGLIYFSSLRFHIFDDVVGSVEDRTEVSYAVWRFSLFFSDEVFHRICVAVKFFGVNNFDAGHSLPTHLSAPPTCWSSLCLQEAVVSTKKILKSWLKAKSSK